MRYQEVQKKGNPMNHDQGIIVDEVEANGGKAKQKVTFGALQPWYLGERIVPFPHLEFSTELFDCFIDLLGRLKQGLGRVQPAINPAFDKTHTTKLAEKVNIRGHFGVIIFFCQLWKRDIEIIRVLRWCISSPQACAK